MGDLMAINEHGGTRYEHTRQTCIQVGTLSSAEVIGMMANTELSSDKQSIRIIPNEFELFDWRIEKLEALPAVCHPENLIVSQSPTAIFEHLWHTFNDYYAFFDERGIDWNNQYEQFRPAVTDDMGNDELQEVLDRLLRPINDGHVRLITDSEEFHFAKMDSVEKYIRETFSTQSEYKDIQEYVDSLGQQWKDKVLGYFDSSIGGSAGGSSGENIYWATSTDNVGYLFIGTMQDLTSTQSGLDSEILEAVNRIMTDVLSDLCNTDALIIDVRFNGGGFDAVSLAIANYFTDQSGLAYSKYVRNYSGDGEAVEVFFSSATETPYLKPIVIISSQNTYSAAEVFLIMMSSLPHVTILGESTVGVLADQVTKTLPNNWKIEVPNVVFVDSKGRKPEVVGVTPDVEVSLDIAGMFDRKGDAAIEAALDTLGL